MAWVRLRWALGLAALAVATAQACGYPDFTYATGTGGQGPTGSSSTTGPGGGQGGAIASSTRQATIASISSSSSSSTGGSGGGGGPVAQVPCIDGTMCDPGQICCFNYGDGTCDECIEITGACGSDMDPQQCGVSSNYARYNCNTNDDCKHGEVCCEDLACDGTSLVASSIYCTANCQTSTTRRISCESGADCPGAQPCQLVSFDYPGYGYCGQDASTGCL